MDSAPIGIPCPHCGSTEHGVWKTYQEHGYIRRRRICSCGRRFTTTEKLPNQAPPEQVDKSLVAAEIRRVIEQCGLDGHI